MNESVQAIAASSDVAMMKLLTFCYTLLGNLRFSQITITITRASLEIIFRIRTRQVHRDTRVSYTSSLAWSEGEFHHRKESLLYQFMRLSIAKVRYRNFEKPTVVLHLVTRTKET